MICARVHLAYSYRKVERLHAPTSKYSGIGIWSKRSYVDGCELLKDIVQSC